MKETDIEIIDRYIRNELTQQERQDVEQRLKADQEFEATFREVLKLSTGIRISAFKDLRKEMLEWDREMRSEKDFRKIKWNPLYTGLAIAALVVVAIGLVFLLQKKSINGEELFAANFTVPQDYTMPPNTRGDNSEREAYEAYDKGNYILAEEKFQEYLVQADDENAKFYYAISLLENNKTEKAIDVLVKIYEINKKPREGWYLSLALVKDEQYSKAKKILQDLQNEPSYEVKAAALQEKLE